MQRLLVCRPQGGLNDMLCQIEQCCRYAERFDRTVLVETDYAHATYFNDSFARYFVSHQRRLVFKTDHIDAYGDMTDVFPAVAAGRMTEYLPRFDRKTGRFVDDASDVPLSFDFSRDYGEGVLLHHASGGGTMSVNALSRMRLHDNVTDLLLWRLRVIGERYSAVHIRNSDYKTKYEQKIDQLGAGIAGPIFVATDNRNCLTYCRTVFGADRVKTFARLPAVAGEPLHRGGVPDAYEANRDAIVDVLMLAMAGTFYALELEKNDAGAKYSGFSTLAMSLQASKPLLSRLIARADPDLDRVLWSS